MPKIPDYIENKTAVSVQRWFVGVGIVTALGAWGAFSAGDGGTGMICVLFTSALWFIASKIKTRKRFRGSANLYQ